MNNKRCSNHPYQEIPTLFEALQFGTGDRPKVYFLLGHNITGSHRRAWHTVYLFNKGSTLCSVSLTMKQGCHRTLP